MPGPEEMARAREWLSSCETDPYDRGPTVAALAELLEQVARQAREDERARIVAWLDDVYLLEVDATCLPRCIERGDHAPPAEPGQSTKVIYPVCYWGCLENGPLDSEGECVKCRGRKARGKVLP